MILVLLVLVMYTRIYIYIYILFPRYYKIISAYMKQRVSFVSIYMRECGERTGTGMDFYLFGAK